MLTSQSQHVPQMNRQPLGIIGVVIGKQVWDQLAQCLTVEVEVCLTKRSDQHEDCQFHWQHQIPVFRLRTLLAFVLTPSLEAQYTFIDLCLFCTVNVLGRL